jgi:hypothetical protein
MARNRINLLLDKELYFKLLEIKQSIERERGTTIRWKEVIKRLIEEKEKLANM